MAWLNNIFGSELSMGVQLALLFATLIVALLLIFWLFRKIFGGASTRYSKSRQPRLSITDAAVVDDKRRLVLVRRDDVEHLVMIGGPSDVVIEQNIVRASPVAMPAHPAPTQYSPPPTPAEPAVEPRKEAPQPAPQAAQASQVKTEPEGSGLFASSPVKSTLAVGGASLAGAGALAMSAKDTVADAASDVVATTSNVVDDVTAPIEKTIETVSETVSDSPEISTNEIVESIGSELSADLDAALQADSPTVETETKAADSKTEDEMQRLLKELAAGN